MTISSSHTVPPPLAVMAARRSPTGAKPGWLLALLIGGFSASGCRCSDPHGIESHDPRVRAAAVAAVKGSRRDGDQSILLLAQNDPSPLVRKAAAGLLAVRGGPAGIEGLGKLAADPDADVAVMAARGLSALPSTPRSRELLAVAYGKGGSQARMEIAAALTAIGGSIREAVELEARLAWHRNVRVLEQGAISERAGAVTEIGRSGRAEAVRLLEPLLDPERKEPSRVVAAAARALGLAGDHSIRPALEALLEEARDVERAEAAADGLGALGDPLAVKALAGIASTGPPRLASAAVSALGALPHAPEVGSALCRLATQSMDSIITARAAAQVRARDQICPERPILARLGRAGETLPALTALAELHLAPEAASRAVKALLPLLAGGDARRRVQAIRTLGRLGTSVAVAELERRAEEVAEELELSRAPTDGDGGDGRDVAAAEHDEAAAASELGELLVALARLRSGPGRALSHVTDRSEILRARAVEALGFSGSSGVAERLAVALEDPSPRVRLAAVEGLGRIGPAAIPALSGFAPRVSEGDPTLAGAVARALAETGSPEAVTALTSLANGVAPAAAVQGLGRIGTSAATAALVQLLGQPGLAGRVEALEALGGLGDPQTGPAIARELTSDRPEVRAAAARAIGRSRQAVGGTVLEALRSDYYAEVRRAAIEALAKLPHQVSR